MEFCFIQSWTKLYGTSRIVSYGINLLGIPEQLPMDQNQSDF